MNFPLLLLPTDLVSKCPANQPKWNFPHWTWQELFHTTLRVCWLLASCKQDSEVTPSRGHSALQPTQSIVQLQLRSCGATPLGTSTARPTWPWPGRRSGRKKRSRHSSCKTRKVRDRLRVMFCDAISLQPHQTCHKTLAVSLWRE